MRQETRVGGSVRAVIPVSIALGLVWNAIALWLMGARGGEFWRPSWLLAGTAAGIATGLFTIRSRRRRDGRETLLDVLATYYVGMFVYWASFVVIARASLCIRHGGWTDFDLADHLHLIQLFLIYGTLWYGIALIPLAFLSRGLLWKVYVAATRRES